MGIPDYLIAEMNRRLTAMPCEETTLKTLQQAGIDVEREPGPEPDLDSLRQSCGTVTDAGSIIVGGSVAFLGYANPVHLRISYAGEFGFDPAAPEHFCFIGIVVGAELLVWDTGASAPRWVEVHASLLSRDMEFAMEELILAQVAKQRGIKIDSET